MSGEKKPSPNRKQWVKPVLVSSLEQDLNQANSVIEKLKVNRSNQYSKWSSIILIAKQNLKTFFKIRTNNKFSYLYL